MIEMECKTCHELFKCNGDRICLGTLGCYCKKCSIKNGIDNNPESLNECYKENSNKKEKVSFT